MVRRKFVLWVVGAFVALSPILAFAEDGPPPAPGPPSSGHSSILLVLAAIAWPAFTGVVNSLFHMTTPKDVDAWAERNPTIAKIAALMRRFGFEPIAGLAIVFSWMGSNPPMPSVISGNIAMGKRRGFGELRVVIGLGILGAILAACGALASAPATIPAAIDLAKCEAQVARDLPGASFELFVETSINRCSGDAGLVVDVLESILKSRDPAVAGYQDAAREAMRDPVKLQALRTRVGHR